MSTKAIRKALAWLKDNDLDEELAAAMAEVESIEKAAKVTVRSVRMAATAAGAEAQAVLESIARDAP